MITINNELIFILSKESILLNVLLKDQKKKIRINNVFHCSELHYNLLEVETLESKEFFINIKNEKFNFLNAQNKIALIETKFFEENYYINILSIEMRDLQSFTIFRLNKAFWRQWHRRLAHLNMNDVKKLAFMSTDIDVEAVNALEKLKFSQRIYESCVINKSHKI